ncbi:MAG: FAD-dependent monooxygenase, partial [Dehalococcoidia bacterium]|nr:FAD-dependent monooxygenase [Dehalococcoidia bacterium]
QPIIIERMLLMPKKYDVIVVGAGPAGLLAARAAAESGLDVALLEKKKEPWRLTRACGQTLVAMNERLFGNICNYNSRDKLIVFSGDGFSARYDGPRQNVYAVLTHAPNGQRVSLGDPTVQRQKGDAGRVAMAFDKEVLFRQWLDAVRALHVDIFNGVRVEQVRSQSDRVIVEGSGKVFEGSYVIAADGTNSVVARVAGFNEKRTYYCNLYALAYEVSGINPPAWDAIIRVGDWVEGKYSSMFIIPRFKEGDSLLALITVDPQANLETALEYFATKAFCAPWFKGMKKLRKWVAGVSCYSPIEEPYKDRILVAGDAAATQELENSGAMLSGWKAGQAIATAVLEGKVGQEVKGISDYINWWQATYVKGVNPEDYIKSFAAPIIFENADNVNFFYGLMAGTYPAAYNPYSSPTASAMKRLVPIIQQQRPDLLEKLKRRALPAAQLYADLARISRPILVED